VAFDLLVGNHDAHGKNVSLLVTDQGLELAPRYDVLSTAVYPELSDRLAMKIGGKDRPERIFRRHVERFAADAGLAPPQVSRRFADLAGRLPGVVAAVRRDFAGRGLDRPILDDVGALVDRRCARIADILTLM